MHKETIERVENLNQASLQSLRRVADINARMWQRVTEQQVEALSEVLATGVKQFELLSEVESPQDVVAGQVKLAVEYNEKAIARAGELVDSLAVVRDELKECLTESAETAQQVLRPAEKAKPKKAAS